MEIVLRHREGRKVEYLASDGRWKSTGMDTKRDAFRWVEIHGEYEREAVPMFGIFAERFMNDESPGSYIEISRTSGKMVCDSSWAMRCSRIKTYIIPYFCNDRVDKITPMMIQKWLISVKGIRADLSSGTKIGALSDLSAIMKYAVFCGYISDNPCSKIIGIGYKPVRTSKKFTDEELGKLFPDNDIELMRIWKNRSRACYFMILKDTGWRPGEASSITPECFIEEIKGIYIRSTIDIPTKKIKNKIKTSKRGYDINLGFLSDRTIGFFKDLIRDKRPGEPVFIAARGGLFTESVIWNCLNQAMDAAGVDHEGHSPYSFRRTFMTNLSQKYSDSVVMELMGHKQWHSCYDKRTPVEMLEKLNKELADAEFRRECDNNPIRQER